MTAEDKKRNMSSPFEEYDETHSGKLMRKMKDAPFVPIGIAGLLIACGIGAYKYRHRGTMSTSVFLMQLRVAAQGTVVGCMTLGLAYQMLNEYVFKDKSSEKPK